MNNYQICNQCVMDTSDPDIFFDNEGNCNHCNDFISNRAKHKFNPSQSPKKLKELIAKIKKAGKGKKYDCVLGLSGGIDSCYAAYVLKQNGLRVLAVHLDNGWNSEEAVRNIRNIATILEIDYESFVLDWNEFKEIQLAFLKASVPEAETPTDMAIPAAWHAIASKHKVKYIISGGNFATEGILPKKWHYNAKDSIYFKSIINKFSKIKIKTFPIFGLLEESYFKIFKRIKIIYILNYVDYDKKNAMDFLKTNYKWQFYGGKHYESVYTGFIQSYYLYKKFNIDYRRATFSAQICSGTIDRKTAIEELEKKPFSNSKIEKEKKYIAKKLEISTEDFDKIINSEPNWYDNFKNSENLINFSYNLFRKITGKDKLGSF